MHVPIYCINLPRSDTRRRHMQAEFDRLGLAATFVRAVDGPARLDLDQLLADYTVSADHHGLSAPLSLSEIGCYLSHEKAWRLLVHTGAACALICEDDIVFRQPFVDLVRLVQSVPADCDLLYLHYLNTESGLTAPAFDPTTSLPVTRVDAYRVFSAWSCGGTSCYIMTARGAAKVLPASRPIRFPVDGQLARLAFAARITVYAVHPMAVATAGFDSTITESDLA